MPTLTVHAYRPGEYSVSGPITVCERVIRPGMTTLAIADDTREVPGVTCSACRREAETTPETPTETRLRYAREALIDTGYFTPEQVGDDIAPRITELWIALRGHLVVDGRDVTFFRSASRCTSTHPETGLQCEKAPDHQGHHGVHERRSGPSPSPSWPDPPTPSCEATHPDTGRPCGIPDPLHDGPHTDYDSATGFTRRWPTGRHRAQGAS